MKIIKNILYQQSISVKTKQLPILQLKDLYYSIAIYDCRQQS